jgi:polyisoprenoid-binding protein YceI
MTQAHGNSVPARLDGAALTGTWVLDPVRSTVSIRSRSVWGLVPVKGVFRTVSGEGTVSPEGDVRGTLTVDAASIDTRNTKRDQHLRSADFFAADAYPSIVFTVDQVRTSGPDTTVSGRLTVRDQTRPLSFTVTPVVHGDGEVWLDAEVPVDRSDFGLTWNQLGMSSMHNTIAVHGVFTRQ